MSRQATEASARAAWAATTPYSTKLRPHLPHGCMPAPRTAMSCSLTVCSSTLCLSGLVPQGCPLPDHVLVLVVLVERPEHELHLHTDRELLRVGAGGEATEHD